MDLVAGAGTEDDAKPVANTLQALLTLGRNAVQGMRQDQRGLDASGGEAMEWIVEAGGFPSGQGSHRDIGRLRALQAKSSLDLAGGVKFLVPAVAAANTASRRKLSVNNLKQIGLAFHNYQSEKNAFRPRYSTAARTARCPIAGESRSCRTSSSTSCTSSTTSTSRGTVPTTASCLTRCRRSTVTRAPTAARRAGATPHISSSPAMDGAQLHGRCKPRPSRQAVGRQLTQRSTDDLTDGTSNTILAVEAKRDVPWTKPEDIPFDLNGPLPELGGFMQNGFNAAFADGSVRFISKSMSPTVLKALITRAGGEVISHFRSN